MKREQKWNFNRALVVALLCLVAMMVFSLPSQALTPLGKTCTTHQQCVSQRCDNRPNAGCVSQDGTGNGGEFCTTHQQCRAGLCNITPGTYTGTCSGNNLPLGKTCTTHQQCVSQRCDNRPNAGCVAQDGTGQAGRFCTTHQQCHSGFCNVTNGLRGTCTAWDQANGKSCRVWSECLSKNCDKSICAPPKSSQSNVQNPLKVVLGPHFNTNAPNRTIYYIGTSQVAVTPPKKAVITNVKNSSQYQIQLTYTDKFGKVVGQSVWVNAGASTGAFNGYEATASWQALGPESGSLVGGNKSISIDLSWGAQ